MKQYEILLVDDENINLEILKEVLEDDFTLKFAKNGQLAMDIINKKKPDLILLDVMMPEMNGWEVLKRIKKNPDLSSIPVIMQTALSSETDFQKGLALGAYYYIKKPLKIEIIVPLINAALRDHEQLRQLIKNLEKADITLALTDEWKLHFRTREQATSIAKLIAKACPEPDQSLIGLLELLLNAVEHGIAEIGYDDKSKFIKQNAFRDELEKRLNQEELQNKYAHLHFKKNKLNISITVDDPGSGFNWKDYQDFNIDRAMDSHGRGIAMAKSLSFDSLEYNEKGNRVTAKININQED